LSDQFTLSKKQDMMAITDQDRRDGRKLAIPIQEGWLFESIDHIRYLEAEGNYTCLHFADGRRTLVSRNLMAMEQQLAAPYQFFRIHRSYVINLNYLAKFLKTRQPILLLDDDTRLPLAQERRAAFDEALMLWCRF
jgi:two-component system LytT family response regulator